MARRPNQRSRPGTGARDTSRNLNRRSNEKRTPDKRTPDKRTSDKRPDDRRPTDKRSTDRRSTDRESQNREHPDREYYERRKARALARERHRAAQKKKRILLVGVVALLLVSAIIIGALALRGNGNNERDNNIDTQTEANQDSGIGVDEDGNPANVPADFRNALRSGRDFLNLYPMSRSSLEEQLENEGFSRDAIDFALGEIDNTVDWYEQAAILAERYLYSPDDFTESSLIDQLVTDGFTQSQATHGASIAFSE
jgi:hypothetical protein